MTAVPTRSHRPRAVLATAIVAGALALAAGPAGAADRPVDEPDRCDRLAEQLEYLPAEWPAAQVMRASLDRCHAA